MLSVADIGLKFCLSIVTAVCCRVDRDHFSIHVYCSLAKGRRQKAEEEASLPGPL